LERGVWKPSDGKALRCYYANNRLETADWMGWGQIYRARIERQKAIWLDSAICGAVIVVGEPGTIRTALLGRRDRQMKVWLEMT
jgi:hypothetical protein